MERKRGLMIGAGIVAVLAVVAAAVWFVVLRPDDDGAADRPGMKAGDPAADLADAFAAAWVDGDWSEVPFSSAAPDGPNRLALITAQLTPADVDRPASVKVNRLTAGAASASGNASATAEATVTWELGQHTWTYDTQIHLVEEADADGGDAAWKVAWRSSTAAPGLQDGESLRATRTVPTRGEIVDAAGSPLVGQRPVVVVGIQPGAADDAAALARQVAGIVDVDAEALVTRVTKADPDSFVEVVTLRREAYDAIRDQVYPLKGTRFREEERSLAPSKDFARALIGTVGPATAEIVERSEGKVTAGDIVGLSGLQAAQNDALAGTPGLKIESVPSAEGAVPRLIKDFPAVPGKPLQVTLDQRVQLAADAVMASAPKPAALVAIRVSNGDVLAVSNGPTEFNGYNRAMIGKYPPGSTFKMVSALAFFEAGLTPDQTVECPATLVVGKSFRNAENEVLGSVSFRDDFAHSCNTAFVGQSRTITPEKLTETAALLGFRPLEIGMPLFGGSVPTDTDETEHAAASIGQGRVEASPLAVALSSATVANGRSLTPRLVIDPAKPEPVFGAALPEPAVTYLREVMRAVVTDGTGGALADVPGGEVHGKTGTAEFGTEVPPLTHAWFTGYQGDVAFAVVVEDGGFGGQTAAPLAAQFLTKLANG